MERDILHSDLNGFYASVECVSKPELKNVPMAVGGDPEQRHGIVLAKNDLAKAKGVSTGEPLWQARKKCPDIVFVPPHFSEYMKYSAATKAIYAQYSDQVESYGLDECWIDVTGSKKLFGSATEIADAIRLRVKRELGLTVSIGVSYNKAFAKLGSDLRKPDFTNIISKENYKQVVWPLPVSDLLFVGKATTTKLAHYGVKTIGDLALVDRLTVISWLGKNGEVLWQYANGLDRSIVSNIEEKSLPKSIGNSTTAPRDLLSDEDVKITLYVLADSVAARLRQKHLKCRTVSLSIKINDLTLVERQTKLEFPLCTSNGLAEAAFALYKKHHTIGVSIRALGIQACDLQPDEWSQMSLFSDYSKNDQDEKLENVMDTIRSKYGNGSVKRAILMSDKELSKVNPKEDHTTFPTKQ